MVDGYYTISINWYSVIQLAIRIPPDKRTILRISIGILMFSDRTI